MTCWQYIMHLFCDQDASILNAVSLNCLMTLSVSVVASKIMFGIIFLRIIHSVAICTLALGSSMLTVWWFTIYSIKSHLFLSFLSQ